MASLKVKNLRMAAKLGLAFGAVVGLLIAVSAIGMLAASDARSHAEESTADFHWQQLRMDLRVDAGLLALAENSVAGDYLGHVSASGDLASFVSARQEFLADYAKVTKDTFTPTESRLLSAAKSAFGTYVVLSDEANQDFATAKPAEQAKAEVLIGDLSVGSILTPLTEFAQVQTNEENVADSSAISSASGSEGLILGVGAAAVVLAALLSVLLIRSLTKPLAEAVSVLDASAAGDLKRRANINSDDELGRMAQSLNRSLEATGEVMSEIGSQSRSLAGASEQLSSVSHHLSSSAEDAAGQATAVSAAAEQVTANIQTVAASADELAASIKEIARSASDASRVAGQGVDVARDANHLVGRLSQSSGEIGEVVKVITSIAEQTNLLALNATIEAARAGEAGRGFAIVANEVKELAKETATATEGIANKIEAIQSDSGAVIEAISQIDGIMGTINEAQGTIASAVEQQTATTNLIGRNIADAAAGSSDMARNVAHVATTVKDTTSAAAETMRTAEEMARVATKLEELVARYR